MNLQCAFCQASDPEYLCDGELEDGRICSKNICKQCTSRVSTIFSRLSRRDKKTGSRCHTDTVDLCPDCKAKDRKAAWGGMTIEHAMRELGKAPVPEQLTLG
jgi:hypothetical protein